MRDPLCGQAERICRSVLFSWHYMRNEVRDRLPQRNRPLHGAHSLQGHRPQKSSVINGYLDKLGGELNAYTTKEEIVLHATVLKEDLMKASSLLMEIATSATFLRMRSILKGAW